MENLIYTYLSVTMNMTVRVISRLTNIGQELQVPVILIIILLQK